MLNLLHAEWIKLSRRPMAWILLAIFLVLMTLYLFTWFLVVALHDGTFTGGQTQFQLLPASQVAQYRLQLRFPGIFGAVLGQINSIGGICAIILTAGALGSEYNWGTLRSQLARQPRRGHYLAAKTVCLLLVLLLGMTIALLIGSLLGWIFGSITGNPGQVGLRDLLFLPLGMLRALYVILPYMMFTLACCVIGRSALAGVAGGLLFLTLDISVGALAFLGDISGLPGLLFNLTIQPNINTLVVLNSQAYGLDPSLLSRNLDLQHLPPPIQALLVVGVYSALFFGYAYRWFVRRDITGAT